MPTPLDNAEERPRGPCRGAPLLVACPTCGLLVPLDLHAVDAARRCPRGHPFGAPDVPGVREVAAWATGVLAVIDPPTRRGR